MAKLLLQGGGELDAFLSGDAHGGGGSLLGAQIKSFRSTSLEGSYTAGRERLQKYSDKR